MDNNNMSDEHVTRDCRVVDVISVDQNVTTIGLSIGTDQDFGPIVGYAEVPLLPLVEACAPLTNIIFNILTYAQLALDEASKVPLNRLTIDESAAIRLYTLQWVKPHRSLYSMLNHTLRTADREELRPYFKYMKVFLTALAKLPCGPQQTVWRGANIDLSKNFPRGIYVTWWEFSSCTTQMKVLNNNMYLGTTGARTLFSVETINARDIHAYSHYPDENEVLLLPGTNMIVQSQSTPAPDLHIIHLKQIEPKNILLELPFKGTSVFSFVRFT